MILDLSDDLQKNDQNRLSKGEMLFKILHQAVPCSLCAIIMMAQGMINTAFVGHLNNPMLLAGLGMGHSIQNIFGTSVLMGLNYAFEIISSRLKGSGDMTLIGIYLNRTRFINICLLVPIFIILNFTGYFMTNFLSYDEETAKVSQEFVMANFPALVLQCFIYVECIYLNLFEIKLLPVISWIIGGVCHIGLCYYFLHV